LQEVVQQAGFLLQIEENALEEQFLVGDFGDDVQELFVGERLRAVFDDGVDGVVELVGAELQEDHFPPALVQFGLPNQFVGVQLLDLGPAVVHQLGGVLLALQDTQLSKQHVVHLLAAQPRLEQDH